MVHYLKKIYKYLIIFAVFNLLYIIVTFFFNQIVDRFFSTYSYNNSLGQLVEGAGHIELESSATFLFIRELIVVIMAIIASIKLLSFSDERKAFITLFIWWVIFILIAYLYGRHINSNNLIPGKTIEFDYSIPIAHLSAFLLSGLYIFNVFKKKRTTE